MSSGSRFTLSLTCVALVFASFSAQAQQSPVSSALAYLQARQSKGDDGYDLGQWRSQVTSSLPSFIGVGTQNVPAEEPTAFIAGSIANILAEIYLLDNEYTEIPAMVSEARQGLKNYAFGSVFHFYPPKKYGALTVRGARFMHLSPKWQGFTNTPPDADTTSVSGLLIAYDSAIQNKTSLLQTNYKLPPRATTLLGEFRDVNRGAHLFNAVHMAQNTGAFLTWFQDENDPRMPRDFFATPDKGMRIPFGKNDVDCVVNANVLKVLTATSQKKTPGYAETCNYLNQIAAGRDYFNCGQYYPSTYVLPYTMGTALAMGTRCLEPSRAILLNEMLRRQNADGSWTNETHANPDFVQSTAWALSTILQTGNPEDSQQRAAVKKGIHFLLSQARQTKDGKTFWSGEVFYAAIFVARDTVLWRSTAYTTATVLKTLVLADKKWNLH